MSMNEEFGKRGDDRQGNHLLPPYYFTELPQCKFYKQGLTEANKGWLEAIVALIRNARGKILVAVVVVLALCKVACEFLEKGNNDLSYKSIIGTLLVALMILIVGLISLRRVKDTDGKEKRKKDKIEPVESGTSRISPGQNRRPSTRDRGSNLDGGGE